jgi:hypothetical protein
VVVVVVVTTCPRAPEYMGGAYMGGAYMGGATGAATYEAGATSYVVANVAGVPNVAIGAGATATGAGAGAP